MLRLFLYVLKLLRYLNESKICIAYLRGFRLVKSMSSFISNPTDFRILLGFLLGVRDHIEWCACICSFWRWWICLSPGLGWWFHGYMRKFKAIKSYTLNICSFCTTVLQKPVIKIKNKIVGTAVVKLRMAKWCNGPMLLKL